jgi:peptide/nickel transport system substrate-binding protein
MTSNSDRRDFLKHTAASAAALATIGSGLVPSLAAAQGARTLTVAWDTDIDTLDPASFKSIGGYTVQANIYDSPLMWKVQPVAGKPGLLQSRPGEMEGGIAESWAFEKDGATLVLKTRKGVKFPSGRPVNAAAMKYLFDRGLQSPGYMRILFPRLLRVTKPEQFEVRDEYTFAINMPASSPMTLDTMALINNALLDPAEVKANATAEDPWATNWLKRNSGGSGPYKLVKNEPGVEVVLEARKDHWRPAPFFERVVFKFVPNEADRVLLLKRKAVDMVVGRPGLSPRHVKSLEGEAGLKIVTVPDTTCHWLCMNSQKAPFNNVKVRQAINYAIPIQAIIPSVLFGYGSEMKSPVPSLTPGHDATASPYKHDLEKAKSLMREAGLGGAAPITIDLAVRVGWQPHEQAAVWIQTELEKIGFKVNIAKETDATFRQLASKGDHQLSIESWQSWINDPFYHLFFNFHSTAKGTNTAFYSNPEVDKLIDDNMHERDTAKRLAAAKRLQKILIDEAVWGHLWYDNWTRVMRSDLVGIEKRWDTFERYFNMKLA